MERRKADPRVIDLLKDTFNQNNTALRLKAFDALRNRAIDAKDRDAIKAIRYIAAEADDMVALLAKMTLQVLARK